VLEDYRKLVEESESKLTEAFEKWLAKQSKEDLENIIRKIWEQKNLIRILALPYDEILSEAKKR
jgi:hypothetical protein